MSSPKRCSSCKCLHKPSAFGRRFGKPLKTCIICLDKKANSLPRVAKREAVAARRDAWGARWKAIFGSGLRQPEYPSCVPEAAYGRQPVPETAVLKTTSLSD